LAGGGWIRTYVVFGVGVIVACGFVVAVYLGSPHDYQHSQGDEDGEMFLGRWWEPAWIMFVAGVGYVSWIVGVGLGTFVRLIVSPARSSEAAP